MKPKLKQFLFGLIGKDPEGVVATFATGTPAEVEAVEREIRQLVPDRRHILVEPADFLTVRNQLAPYRIAQACVIFNGDKAHDPLRWTAFALAPGRILAYNRQLERFHLKASDAVASLAFLAGVPLAHIFDRPWSRHSVPAAVERLAARGYRAGRPRAAILTPYFPWPQAHGGAVRLFNLIRECASEFDIGLFSLRERDAVPDPGPLSDLCAEIVTAERPRYRKPRWWGLKPPEVEECRVPALAECVRGFDLVQVEYTQMAGYRGDVLVEHDVTFDLAAQAGGGWNHWRWHRYERAAVRRFERTVVMSEKDRLLLADGQCESHLRVIANGVDLVRFQPSPEPPGRRLLFVASFAHYPNMVAYRFLLREVWPLLAPGTALTVVAGRNPEEAWRAFTGETAIPAPAGVEVHHFVAQVEGLYRQCNLVVVPTLVSAGTNLKVLEAMAAGRAIVSTPSGCAGLGLTDGKELRIITGAPAFAGTIDELLGDAAARSRLASAARATAEERFGWEALGRAQREVWRELLR